METACLRIKFKPLVQKKTINNSKCCLEIVPEVSCVQNLDKLVWRQENNFIEYTIPMTYKVVLQKRQATQDNIDTTVKTYHSCVDLLLTSSNSMLGSPGAGDVAKIISDTFILKKCIEDCTTKEDSIHGLTDEHKHSDNDLVLSTNFPVSHETTNTLLQLEDKEKKETETSTTVNKEETSTNIQKKSENEGASDIKLDKITNTENKYPGFGDTLNAGNIVMKTATAKNSIKHDTTRWLSLSPICSVNTHETAVVNKMVASKAVACKIHESQQNLVLLGTISPPSNFYYDNLALSTIVDVTNQTSPKNMELQCKTPPEIRVVEYLRFIENEILPLRMWLNDIIRKCTALGIEFRKESSKEGITIKTVSTSSGPEMTISEKSKKSNRVVYSIVYDK